MLLLYMCYGLQKSISVEFVVQRSVSIHFVMMKFIRPKTAAVGLYNEGQTTEVPYKKKINETKYKTLLKFLTL